MICIEPLIRRLVLCSSTYYECSFSLNRLEESLSWVNLRLFRIPAILCQALFEPQTLPSQPVFPRLQRAPRHPLWRFCFFRLCFIGAGSHYYSKGFPVLCCQVLSQTADFHQFSCFPSSKRSPRHSLLDIVSFPTVFRRRRDRLSFSRLPSIIFPRSVPSCRLFQSILLPPNQARATPSFFGTFFSSDSISSALDHIIILKAPQC